ncbi:MAG: glycosyltransferase [Pseudomonadota bacterium]
MCSDLSAGDHFMAARRFLHVFPNFDPGGVQLRSATLMNALGEDVSHEVIALAGDEGAAYAIADEVEVKFRTPDIPPGGNAVSRILAIRKWLRAAAPDLLLTYNWGSIEWALGAMLAGCPHIHHESGFSVEEAETQLPRRVWFRRVALLRTIAVIVPSQTLAEIATKTWRLPSRKVKHIPDGIDLDRFSGEADPAVLKMPEGWGREDHIIVGTVAPLRPEKNIGRMILAIRALRDRDVPISLVVAGDGPEKDHLKAVAKQLEVEAHVHFAGYVTDIEKAYGCFDIYVITSDTEQLPNAVLQAMANELPICGLGVGDVPHMVSEENRPFIAPQGDDDGFIRRLWRLSGDVGARRSIGAKNKDKVHSVHDMVGMIAAYRLVYQAKT